MSELSVLDIKLLMEFPHMPPLLRHQICRALRGNGEIRRHPRGSGYWIIDHEERRVVLSVNSNGYFIRATYYLSRNSTGDVIWRVTHYRP